MRKPIAIAALSLGLPLAAQADMVRFDLDPDHTVIAFKVSHIGFADVLGQFTDVTGHVMFDPEARDLGAVEVSVPIDSLTTFNAARDEHIRSEDFLWADEQASLIFTANGGSKHSDTTGTVTGELTLRDQIHPVTLDVTLNKIGVYPFGHERQTVGISAIGTLDRSEWGMTYGLEQGMVGDTVELIIETEAVRAAPPSSDG